MRQTMPRLGLGVILVLLLSSTFVVGQSAPPAHATSHKTLENFNTSRDPDKTKCAIVYEWDGRVLLNFCTYRQMDQTQWNANKVGETRWGYAKIILRNKYFHRCLAPGSKTHGAYVYTVPCFFRDGRRNGMTKWVMKGSSRGVSKLRKTGTSKCLGIDGTWRGARLRLWNCKPDAPYQQWGHPEFTPLIS